MFRSVLERIAAQRPLEIIVVINGPQNPALELACAGIDEVRCYWTPVPGKRNALRIGLGSATGEITVLVDSDTSWTHDTLTELVKPFRDPRVGGVTTRAVHSRPWPVSADQVGGLARILPFSVLDAGR